MLVAFFVKGLFWLVCHKSKGRFWAGQSNTCISDWSPSGRYWWNWNWYTVPQGILYSIIHTVGNKHKSYTNWEMSSSNIGKFGNGSSQKRFLLLEELRNFLVVYSYIWERVRHKGLFSDFAKLFCIILFNTIPLNVCVLIQNCPCRKKFTLHVFSAKCKQRYKLCIWAG